MDCSQMIIDPGGMVIVTDSAHSKTRVNGRDPIFQTAARVVRSYLANGRPYLLARGNNAAGDALWITVDGVKAEAGGMAAAMRRLTRGLMKGGVASGDVRRAAASASGLSMAEMAKVLRHRPNSFLAVVNYAERDRARAVDHAQPHGEPAVEQSLEMAEPMQPRCWAKKGRPTRVFRSRRGRKPEIDDPEPS